MPNPERLWKAVSDVYTEEWLKKNWGEIKPIPLNKIKLLNDGTDIKLETNRNLKALYVLDMPSTITLFTMNTLAHYLWEIHLD